MKILGKTFFSIFALALSLACADAKIVLQVGHFPNVTHAQALVAHQLSRQGKGWFEQRLGDDVEIQWRLYNAGPSAMEALFAGGVDITYVGPTPAINAFAKTRGRDIRIIAGSADGGAALVVNPKLGIKSPSDFKGKKIATPQLGNTQDVAARAWLGENGIKTSLTGGEAFVIATANPEQLPLFKSGQVDAVWTVEPWVTRLEKEAGAKVFLEQRDAITTIVVTNNKTLEEKPELVKKFVQAHKELTEWINKNPEEAQKLVIAELNALTGGRISEDLIRKAWPRIIFTPDVNQKSFQKFYDDTYKCGFIKKVDISKIHAKQQ